MSTDTSLTRSTPSVKREEQPSHTGLDRFMATYTDTSSISDRKIPQTLIDDTIEALELCIVYGTLHFVRSINQHLADLTLERQESFWEGTVRRAELLALAEKKTS